MHSLHRSHLRHNLYHGSKNAGVTWTADERLTYAPDDSVHASVALSSDRAHVVWFDKRDGNAEIYYKRNR